MGGVPVNINGVEVDAATPGCWLDEFLDKTNRNLNGTAVDFICVHWWDALLSDTLAPPTEAPHSAALVAHSSTHALNDPLCLRLWEPMQLLS